MDQNGVGHAVFRSPPTHLVVTLAPTHISKNCQSIIKACRRRVADQTSECVPRKGCRTEGFQTCNRISHFLIRALRFTGHPCLIARSQAWLLHHACEVGLEASWVCCSKSVKQTCSGGRDEPPSPGSIRAHRGARVRNLRMKHALKGNSTKVLWKKS